MVVDQVKQCEGILGQKAPAKQAAELKPLLLEENKIQVLMKKQRRGNLFHMPWGPSAAQNLKLLALVGVFTLQLTGLIYWAQLKPA